MSFPESYPFPLPACLSGSFYITKVFLLKPHREVLGSGNAVLLFAPLPHQAAGNTVHYLPSGIDFAGRLRYTPNDYAVLPRFFQSG